MNDRSFTYAERAFMVGAPLLWALLLLFHPGGDTDDFFPVVTDAVLRWQVVHLGTMVFVPMIGAAVLLMVRGLPGRAATIARAAIVVYVVAYTAWEVLVGVGTGVLVNEVNGLTGPDRAAGIDLIETYNRSSLLMALLVIGGAGLTAGLLAAGRALVTRAGAPMRVLVLLAISIPAIGFHEPPVGPVGLVLFAIAAFYAIRPQLQESTTRLNNATNNGRTERHDRRIHI